MGWTPGKEGVQMSVSRQVLQTSRALSRLFFMLPGVIKMHIVIKAGLM